LIVPGMIFELIVVKKDENLNELGVVLWKHRGEIVGCKYQGKKLGEIGSYNLKGIVKDFEIVKIVIHLERRFFNIWIL
jgi:hypothetical protein